MRPTQLRNVWQHGVGEYKVEKRAYMIGFEKGAGLDMALKNLVTSMLEVQDYLSSVLPYTGDILTPKKERELVDILKKYNVPYKNLKYDVELLTENPYYKEILLGNVNSDKVKYEKNTVKKRTLINMDFHKPLGKYLFHYHPLGYFDEDIVLPALVEGSKVWMSPAVSEIESMRVGIEKGCGKCMTMGLGIGVIPYLWLLKDQVESVTVVEFNKNVIKLFEEYIRPQFKTSKKLEIIHGDAIDYYNEEFLNRFDYVYVDFWESSEDGLSFYTKLMEKKVDFSHIDYWIEDSILYTIKSMVTVYLFTLYQGESIANYISSTDEELKPYAKKINRYFKSRGDVIKTEDELLEIIHSKEIVRKILAQ